jgi:hypothetical protein
VANGIGPNNLFCTEFLFHTTRFESTRMQFRACRRSNLVIQPLLDLTTVHLVSLQAALGYLHYNMH